MPEVQQGVASKLWGLSDASREDCVLLAHALPKDVGALWSSNERKAKETADVLGLRLGLEPRVDPRFGEVDRPQVWDRDFREVVAGYLRGVAEPGWETIDAVVARFGAAVESASAPSRGPTVIATHGTAMTLWVGSQFAIDRVAWWEQLTLPDAWAVDLEAKTLERLWLGGRAG